MGGKVFLMLLLLQLAAIVADANDQSDVEKDHCRRCKKNEEFSDCASACPETCKTLQEPKPCNKKCVRRCKCKPGYVLDNEKSRTCIPIKKCPNVCLGENEEWRTGLSSSCDIPTCDNKEIIIKRPDGCTKDSVSACVCINKTVRDTKGTGKCIKPEKCPKSVQ